MKNLIIILCYLLISSGCIPITKKIYGIKNPDFESHEKILNFQEHIGFGDIPYLGLKPECWRDNQLFSMVDMFIFNAEGKYIPYRDTAKLYCNGPAEFFLSALNSETDYYISNEFTLSTFMERLENPQCQPLAFENSNEIDFYIFMTYSTFSGKKIYKDKSTIWLDSLQNNKQIRFKLYMVNEDLKDCWTPEQKSWLESNSNH